MRSDGWTKRRVRARNATQVATKVLAKRPAYMGALRARALVTSNLADIESDDLHLAKALPLSQGSTRDWESFLQLDPGNTIALNNLAAGYQREGWFLFRTGRVAEAIESYTAATAVEKRTRMSPSFAINQMWPAGSVVFVEADRGNYPQAEAALAHVRQLAAIAGEPRKDASSQATLRMFEANFAAAIPVAKWDFAATAQVGGRRVTRRKRSAPSRRQGAERVVRQSQRSLSRPRQRGVPSRRLSGGGSSAGRSR